MKKVFTFLFVSLTLFSVSCLAQGGKKNMEEMKQRLKDSLKLSNVQVDSLVAIRQEYQPQIRSIMKDAALSQAQKKDKVKPIRQEMLVRLKKLLSDEQIQKLEQMEKDMRKKNANNDG